MFYYWFKQEIVGKKILIKSSLFCLNFYMKFNPIWAFIWFHFYGLNSWLSWVILRREGDLLRRGHSGLLVIEVVAIVSVFLYWFPGLQSKSLFLFENSGICLPQDTKPNKPLSRQQNRICNIEKHIERSNLSSMTFKKMKSQKNLKL